jgi:hypothetical protein
LDETDGDFVGRGHDAKICLLCLTGRTGQTGQTKTA